MLPLASHCPKGIAQTECALPPRRPKRAAAKLKKAPRKVSKPRGRRQSPEERRQTIIDGAVEFFSEVGFDGGTRSLAKRLGITQPLIYYFFPTKDDLLREVYKSVFLDRWRKEWEDQISDRSIPLRQRLITFYTHYTEIVFNPEWIRICMFAALRGCEIDRWWMTFFEENLVRKICIEIRHENRFPRPEQIPLTPSETEAFWNFHGGVFNYGVRREVHRIEPQIDLPSFIEISVDSLLNGFPSTMKAMLYADGNNTG